MKVAGDWIEGQATQKAMSLLTDAGHQAFFVGGCVRNALLDAPISDIDISTDARPETVMALASAAGIKAIPTGIEHGTVTVIIGGALFEITTFRRDVETDGRRAVVAFSDDIHEDAHRRDFTMNALYAQADGTVIDPLGGLPDLHARRFRFIDNASDRIREDYLRILRFFRFFAWYGDPNEGLDPDGLAACAEFSEGIEGLSKERLGSEMLKLLSAPDPSQSVAAMVASGVLSRILEGADARSLPLLIHFERMFDMVPSAPRRLAALNPGDVLKSLRLDKATAKYIAQVKKAAQDSASPKVDGYRLGAEMALDAALLRAAWLETAPPLGLMDDLRRGADAAFPVTAGDLFDRYEGKALGDKLKELESRWIASDFQLTKAALLA